MSEFRWRITNHVCRYCFGRILEEEGGMSRCSSCGASADRVRSLCACGTGDGKARGVKLRCIPNPDRSPELPAEIVVAVR